MNITYTKNSTHMMAMWPCVPLWCPFPACRRTSASIMRIVLNEWATRLRLGWGIVLKRWDCCASSRSCSASWILILGSLPSRLLNHMDGQHISAAALGGLTTVDAPYNNKQGKDDNPSLLDEDGIRWRHSYTYLYIISHSYRVCRKDHFLVLLSFNTKSSLATRVYCFYSDQWSRESTT